MNQPPFSQTSQPQPNVYIQQLPLQNRDSFGDGNNMPIMNYGNIGPNQQMGMNYNRSLPGSGQNVNETFVSGGQTSYQPVMQQTNVSGGDMGGISYSNRGLAGRSSDIGYGGQVPVVSSPSFEQYHQQQQHYGSANIMQKQQSFQPGGRLMSSVMQSQGGMAETVPTNPASSGGQYYPTPVSSAQGGHYNVEDFNSQNVMASRQMSHSSGTGGGSFSQSAAGYVETLPQAVINQNQPVSTVMTSRPGVSVSTAPVGSAPAMTSAISQYSAGQQLTSPNKFQQSQSGGTGGVTIKGLHQYYVAFVYIIK